MIIILRQKFPYIFYANITSSNSPSLLYQKLFPFLYNFIDINFTVQSSVVLLLKSSRVRSSRHAVCDPSGRMELAPNVLRACAVVSLHRILRRGFVVRRPLPNGSLGVVAELPLAPHRLRWPPSVTTAAQPPPSPTLT